MSVKIGGQYTDVYQYTSYYRNRLSITVNATKVRNFILTLKNFENILIKSMWKKHCYPKERQPLLKERLFNVDADFSLSFTDQ